jgi:microcystin-dependent protein
MPLLEGAIVMWSGSTLDIPQGWKLCNGLNGTPDLRNRFIVGAGNLYNVGDTGGSKDAILPSHIHDSDMNSFSHSHIFRFISTSGNSELGHFRGNNNLSALGLSSSGSHTHTVDNISTVGESGIDKNLPPYYALAFIQQIE